MHHIIPIGDDIFHEPFEACQCEPTIKGNCAFHNAADCRELVESATGESYGGYEIHYDKSEPEMRLE